MKKIGLLIKTSILLACVLAGTGVVAAAQQAEVQFDAVINLQSTKAALSVKDEVDFSRAITELSDAAKLVGVKAMNADDKLQLSGTQSFAELRNLLFDEAPDLVNFLGGPMELTMTLPQSNQPVRLELETRPSTGYRWEVTSSAGYSQPDNGSIEMRFPGAGAPAVQIIDLQPVGAGGGEVKLVYRRPFEPNEPVRLSLTMHVQILGLGGVVDLSDPTPPSAPQSSVAIMPQPRAVVEIPSSALPASYDSRTLGIIPSPRNQGGCGACWAFGTVAVMETAIKKAGGAMTDLSEQFLVSCNNDGWSCNGGWTASKYHYDTLAKSQSVIGAVLEADKPYTATNGTCTTALNHPFKGSGWQFLTGSEYTMPTNDAIKNAIVTYGSVTTGVCADSGWDTYTGGVYSPSTNECSGSTNHQIQLIGWDDSTQSWILRNSWGTNWGETAGYGSEKGYMRIKYDPAGTTSRVGEGASWIAYQGSISPPIPISPQGTIQTRMPAYVWQPVTSASWYQLAVLDTAGWKVNQWYSAADANCSSGTCSLTPGASLASGNATWYVRAYNGTSVSDWSTMAFFVQVALPAKPTLISPNETTTNNTSLPTYTWNAVSGASYYYLAVQNAGVWRTLSWYTAAQAGCPTGTGTCALNTGVPLSNGTSNWYLLAWNGDMGPWSDPMAFTVSLAAPSKPTLVSPASGSTQTTNKPPFVWNAQPGVPYYYLAVLDTTGWKFLNWVTSTDANCPTGTGNCSVTLTTPLANGNAAWAVLAWNVVMGPWSDLIVFTVNAQTGAP